MCIVYSPKYNFHQPELWHILVSYRQVLVSPTLSIRPSCQSVRSSSLDPEVCAIASFAALRPTFATGCGFKWQSQVKVFIDNKPILLFTFVRHSYLKYQLTCARTSDFRNIIGRTILHPIEYFILDSRRQIKFSRQDGCNFGDVLSERFRGSMHCSGSGKVRNLTTTPHWLTVVFTF